MSNGTQPIRACCTTPAAMLFWGIAFLAAFVPLTLIGIYYWHPLSAAAAPFAIGIGCVANWLKNRTYHCGITGPIFILAGAALLLAALGVVHVASGIVWGLVILGTIVALALESRYAGRAGGEAS